jgi:hypothetical protein
MGSSSADNENTSAGWVSMKGLGSKMRGRDRKDKTTVTALEHAESSTNADTTLREVHSNDGLLDGEEEVGLGGRIEEDGLTGNGNGIAATTYKVYKRRWFGLFQLALLNIIVSWDVSLSPSTFEIVNYLVASTATLTTGSE